MPSQQAFQSWRDRSIRPTCSTKCSLFSLLHLHVCTPSNFFTTVLIYNWLFPPKIHCLGKCLPKLFRCALKKSFPHEILRWLENIIIIIILEIQDSPYFSLYFVRFFMSVALAWTCSIYINGKRVWNKRGLICVGDVCIEHTPSLGFRVPLKYKRRANGNHRLKQVRAFHSFREQHTGTRAICWLVRSNKANKQDVATFVQRAASSCAFPVSFFI